ncbi:GNAT family N-acetyltransferase [Tabrizicola sp. M-4]|uniref:GNAT family N-acetyltransferase n=1 Tax=Tabrizicola sp. M-4 TaxID=3055847 RepID=UPI003DA7FA26
MASEGAAVGLRAYEPGDLAAVLCLFDGNVPEFFAAGERAEFEEFLKAGPATPYLVLEQAGSVVAAGGVSVDAAGWVTLDWGMVARPLQRGGLGRRLFTARLALARSMAGSRGLRLETSQKTCGFYERFGFRVTAVRAGGFGPGLDAVAMELRWGAVGA